jgi:Cu/Ag efflux protein CusF
MKYIVSTAAVCLALAMASVHATAQDQHNAASTPQGMQRTTSATSTATVKKVDKKNRTVTMKGQDGKTFTVQVGPEARNFDQIKKGDLVTFHYEESLAIGLHKTDQPPSVSEKQALSRAAVGEKPSGSRITTTQITAVVESIDRQSRTVTLRGPQGNLRTLQVGRDVEAFDRLQPGDMVAATYTEAVAIDVTTPK